MVKKLNSELSDLALTRCKTAKQLEDINNYEAAFAALGELWEAVGSPPKLEGLAPHAEAEVLLRVGSLTGWLGRLKQFEGAQDLAKDLLTRSTSIFEFLGNKAKVLEAQIEIAWCYWREGSFGEARIFLEQIRELLSDEDDEYLKTVTLIRSGINELSLGRVKESIGFFKEAEPLVEASSDYSLKGRFFGSFAIALRDFAMTQEDRNEYISKSIAYCSEASRYFKEVGNKQAQAMVENNLGNTLRELDRYDEAESHHNTAIKLFKELNDEGYLAQAYESLSRVLIKTGRYLEAEGKLQIAILILERGGRQSLLVEARTTYGVALARQAKYAHAWHSLEQALEMGDLLGDREGAGRAALSILEELKKQLSLYQLNEIYKRAKTLLDQSENGESLKRLYECERLIGDLQSGVWSKNFADHTGAFRGAVLSESFNKLSKSVDNLSDKIDHQIQALHRLPLPNDADSTAINNHLEHHNSDPAFLVLPQEVRFYRKDDTIKSYIGRVTAILIKEVRGKMKDRHSAADSLGIAASTMDQRLRYANRAAKADAVAIPKASIDI